MQVNSKPTLAMCVTSLGATKNQLKQLPSLLAKLERYFNVVAPVNLVSSDIFDSQPAADRLQSLDEAFAAADVIVAFNGGYNSIELFERFDAIKAGNDKIFIGYSDNTLLVNALPAANKSRGWLGPMIATMLRYPEYVDVWAQNILSWVKTDFQAISSDYNRIGIRTLQEGEMRGRVIGGNAYTFDLLQGTRYSPSFNRPFIYILEGEDFITDKNRIWQDTIRNLDSVLLQPGAIQNIQGLLIGKFPDTYSLDVGELKASINKRAVLKSIPVAYDFPRGYGQPSLTLPVGEELSIRVSADDTITINKL